MEAQTLSAEVRTKSGKGPARQLRMRGMIPAIFYGPGTEPVKLSVRPDELAKLLTGPYGRNQLIELTFGSTKGLALVRDIAIDPVSRELRHVDLYSVAKDRAVDAVVPFDTTGRSIGAQKGGFIRKPFRSLPVRAFPQDVPASIIVDISPYDIGTAVTVKDLPLPSGVKVTYAEDRRLVFIDAKERKRRDVEEETPAAGAAAPGAAPAAPAAT
jgi:large subunit ribosomal protein L25